MLLLALEPLTTNPDNPALLRIATTQYPHMARTGVDKAAILLARDNLIARGVHPSIDAVRIELGNTGSKSTIHRYLRELGQSGPSGSTRISLSEPLSRLVGQLVAQLEQDSQGRIAAAEQAIRSEREQTLAKQQGLEQALAELQQRLADRDRQIQALEALRHGEQQQREQEQARHVSEVRQLRGQLHTLQQSSQARQEELSQLHRDNGRLLAEQQQGAASNSQLQAQLEQRDAQVQGLRTMLAQAQGASDELRRQLAAGETRQG